MNVQCWHCPMSFAVNMQHTVDNKKLQLSNTSRQTLARCFFALTIKTNKIKINLAKDIMHSKAPCRAAVFISVLLLTGACTVAPLSGPKSARTLGKDKLSTTSTIYPTFGQNIIYGVGENTDVGIMAELQLGMLYSIWVKHSVLNNEKGHSLAGIAGAFHSESFANSRGAYLGAGWSFSDGNLWEPYGLLKWNYVEWNNDISINEDEEDLDDFFKSKEGELNFDYFQLHAGAKIHFTPVINMDIGVVVAGDQGGDYYAQPQIAFGYDF